MFNRKNGGREGLPRPDWASIKQGTRTVHYQWRSEVLRECRDIGDPNLGSGSTKVWALRTVRETQAFQGGEAEPQTARFYHSFPIRHIPALQFFEGKVDPRSLACLLLCRDPEDFLILFFPPSPFHKLHWHQRKRKAPCATTSGCVRARF